VSVSERDDAIKAGLHAGECEWCGADVWKDRGTYWEWPGGVWHDGCHDANGDALSQATERARVTLPEGE
jgi:hypothetical protein